ncbi:hypothetical protein [Mucilaginibacter lappiensis]|uniref:Uncharacterized protein n=1 Tax=Mucilaginibacter lappiensis TaxID=354630 RepID=A0A841JIK0_9SPHI|nr:hypothetical protein [Mucilaginibacter lappiensis]MBB6128508.1 hypothetical protein [Mucilaginibacter lappiensis]
MLLIGFRISSEATALVAEHPDGKNKFKKAAITSNQKFKENSEDEMTLTLSPGAVLLTEERKNKHFVF